MVVSTRTPREQAGQINPLGLLPSLPKLLSIMEAALLQRTHQPHLLAYRDMQPLWVWPWSPASARLAAVCWHACCMWSNANCLLVSAQSQQGTLASSRRMNLPGGDTRALPALDCCGSNIPGKSLLVTAQKLHRAGGSAFTCGCLLGHGRLQK